MATLKLENGQTIQIPDGISVAEAQKYVDQANILSKGESGLERFAKGMNTSFAGQAKSAFVPEGLGGDLLHVPEIPDTDRQGNWLSGKGSHGPDLQMVDPQASVGQRALQLLGLGPLAQLFQSDPAQAAGQTAANLPGLLQGLFRGGKVAANSGGVRSILQGNSAGVPAEAKAAMQAAPTPILNKPNLPNLMNPLDWLLGRPGETPTLRGIILRKTPGLRTITRGIDAAQEARRKLMPNPQAEMDESLSGWMKDQSPVEKSGRLDYANPYTEVDPAAPAATPPDPYAGSAWTNPPPLRPEDVQVSPQSILNLQRGTMEYETPPVRRVVEKPPRPEPSTEYRPGQGPQAPPKLRTKAGKVGDVYSTPPPADPWSAPQGGAGEEAPIPTYGQPRVPTGGGASMDWEAPVARQPYQTPGQEGTPPPAQAGRTEGAPATAAPASAPPTVQQQLRLTAATPEQLSTITKPKGSGLSDAQWGGIVKDVGTLPKPEGMPETEYLGALQRFANRKARAMEARDYFTSKGIPAEQVKAWAEQWPAEGPNQQHGGLLAEHARSFGNKRPFTRSIVEETLNMMGLGGGK